jgi:hypothetical protein
MPDYEVFDTMTKRTVTLRGDSPPTEAELTEIFASVNASDRKAGRLPLAIVKEEPYLSRDPNAGEPLSRGGFGQPLPPSQTSSAGMAGYQVLNDIALGTLKGVGNTVFGLGKLFRDYTPVGRISDAIQAGAFENRPPELNPSNTAQRAGYTAEQVGEFFVPVGAPAKFVKAAQVAKSGLIGTAQGGPAAGATSAALTAVIPGGGAAKRAAGALEQSAEKSVAQALGATKEWAKSDAAKLAPEMLQRGVKGSRAAMLEQAKAASAEAGRKLGAAYEAAGAAGKTISGQVIRGELQLAKDGLMIPAANGRMIPIEGAAGVVKKLDKLENFVAQMGDDIPVHHASKVKTAWDRIVAKAGLYGPKAAANATDSEAAWAIREGAGAFRTLLKEASPDIAALSKEYAFWTSLKKVLTATELRTQAQSGGLGQAITTTVGAGTGFASGSDLGDSLTKAFVGAAAGRQFVKLVQSPYWRTVISGPLKQQMADALGSGSASRATSVVSRMMAALPPQVRVAFAQ